MDRPARPLGFSWSYSRDATFDACNRRYFFRYYGCIAPSYLDKKFRYAANRS